MLTLTSKYRHGGQTSCAPFGSPASGMEHTHYPTPRKKQHADADAHADAAQPRRDFLAGSSSELTKGCTARGRQPAVAAPPKIERQVVTLLKISAAAGLLASRVRRGYAADTGTVGTSSRGCDCVRCDDFGERVQGMDEADGEGAGWRRRTGPGTRIRNEERIVVMTAAISRSLARLAEPKKTEWVAVDRRRAAVGTGSWTRANVCACCF